MPAKQALEKEQGTWISLIAERQKRIDETKTKMTEEKRKC